MIILTDNDLIADGEMRPCQNVDHIFIDEPSVLFGQYMRLQRSPLLFSAVSRDRSSEAHDLNAKKPSVCVPVTVNIGHYRFKVARKLDILDFTEIILRFDVYNVKRRDTQSFQGEIGESAISVEQIDRVV